MATYTNSFMTIPTGLMASGDLSAKQYHVVKMASTAGRVVAVNATTDTAIGVLQNDPTDGQAALVAGLGYVKAVSGTSVLAAGTAVGFNTTGRLATGNAKTIGQTITAATAIGDIVTIQLRGLQ